MGGRTFCDDQNLNNTEVTKKCPYLSKALRKGKIKGGLVNNVKIAQIRLSAMLVHLAIARPRFAFEIDYTTVQN